MKSLLFAIGLLAALAPCSRADEGATESPFHLLTMKCTPDDDLGPDTSPQSPPLVIDDPFTPGCNRWEINIYADGDLSASQNTWELPRFDINYGIGDNVQLKYEIPYIKTTAGSGSAEWGESTVGIKHMFYSDDESKTSIAFYPQLTFVDTNSSAVRNGVAIAGTVVTLPVLYSRTIGKTSRGNIDFTADFDYNISSKTDTRDYFSGGVGLGAPLTHRFALMGELYTFQEVAGSSDSPRENLVVTNIAFMATVCDSLEIFGSAGHSLHASDGESHIYTLTGIRLLLGRD